MKRSVSSARQGSSLDLLAAVWKPPSSPERRAAREAHLQLQLLQARMAGGLEVTLAYQGL